MAVTRVFSVWPAEFLWERSMYDLFRTLPRLDMTFASEERWTEFQASIERQGLTLREVEEI